MTKHDPGGSVAFTNRAVLDPFYFELDANP